MRTKTQVLQKAKKILEKGWCKGMEDDGAGNHCATGALRAAGCYDLPFAEDVEKTLAKAMVRGFNPEEDYAQDTIQNYNDAESRRRYQVLAAFDRAIDSLKK